MKKYSGKNLEALIEEACKELGISSEALNYEVTKDKKGLFGIRSIEITVYETEDIVDYACEYIESSLETLGIQSNASGSIDGEIIKISVDSDHNPVLIGKNGKTLYAINELVKLAVSSKFKRRFRILLDIGDYKDKKYSHIAHIARKSAKEVQKTKQSIKLDSMTADERRVVHNALSNFSHIKTESEGEGLNRAVVIKYVD